MKANELRIGNYLLPGDHFIVTAIRENGLIDMENPEYPEDDYCTKGIEEIEPTPLTEEWLVKFGFTIWKAGWMNYQGQIYIKPVDGLVEIGDSWGDTIEVNNIEYVHQLQNLYFALTGEELTIKE
jgi:hypothetical protein